MLKDNYSIIICFYTEDAKIAKAEVNLMSLLSTLDDITDLQPEAEEKEEGKGNNEAPKLPRTNSLEDLGIKVLQFVWSFTICKMHFLTRSSKLKLSPVNSLFSFSS